MDVAQAFGRAIKVRRAEVGMTQEALADKTGMSRAHVSGIERGLHDAGTTMVFKMATALDCKPSELWEMAERFV